MLGEIAELLDCFGEVKLACPSPCLTSSTQNCPANGPPTAYITLQNAAELPCYIMICDSVFTLKPIYEGTFLCSKINDTSLSNHNTLTSPGRCPGSLDKPTCTRQSAHIDSTEPFSFLQASSSLALYRPKMQEVISLVVGSLSKLPTGK